MEPIIAFNLFQSLQMLTAAVNTLTNRCIHASRRLRALSPDGREIDRRRYRAGALAGYERASAVAKEALETGRSVREMS